MKNLLGIVIIVIAVWGVYSLAKSDEYLGFYYPDKNNLSEDISSIVTFDSVEACRDWAHKQAKTLNPSGTGYDYECGKNCNTSGGKPYICEETLR